MRDKQIRLDLSDPPLEWGDGTPEPCRVTVTIGVRDDDESILRLANGLGCERGSDEALLNALYRPAMESVLREAAATLSMTEARGGDAMAGALRERLAASLGAFEVRGVTFSVPPQTTPPAAAPHS